MCCNLLVRIYEIKNEQIYKWLLNVIGSLLCCLEKAIKTLHIDNFAW